MISLIFPIVVAFFFFFSSSVSSTSNGVFPRCDLGWDPSNRIGNGTQMMYWTNIPNGNTPVREALSYTLRSSDGPNPAQDPVSYMGDIPFAIHVRTLDPDNRFCGLMMYAIRGTGPYQFDAEKQPLTDGYQVGSWSIPGDSPFQAHTQYNGRCLTHRTADPKALHNVFWLKIPLGTGPITVRLLIKVGEQNRGWFYQIKPLVLSEVAPVQIPTNAIQSFLGESCTDACNRLGATPYCSSALTMAIQTPAQLKSYFPTATCVLPNLAACNPAVPMIEVTRGSSCSFISSGCSITQSDVCDSFSPTSNRFCICSDTEDSLPQPPAAPAQTSAPLAPAPTTTGAAGAQPVTSTAAAGGSPASPTSAPAASPASTGAGGPSPPAPGPAGGTQTFSASSSSMDMATVGPAVGGGVGGFLLLMAVIFFCRLRSGRKYEKSTEMTYNPVVSSPTGENVERRKFAPAPIARA